MPETAAGRALRDGGGNHRDILIGFTGPNPEHEAIARRLLHEASEDPSLSPCDDAWESAAIFVSLLDDARKEAREARALGRAEALAAVRAALRALDTPGRLWALNALDANAVFEAIDNLETP